MLGRIGSKLNITILKNSVLGLLGTFMIRAINLISIPIFTRLLDTSDYGRVNIFVTYAGIFTVLLGLDFQGSVAKGTFDYKTEKDKFFSASLFFTSLFTVVVLVIVNIFSEIFSSIFQMTSNEINVLLIYSYASFVIAYKSLGYVYQLQYKKNLILGVGVGVLNLIFSIVLILTLFEQDKFMGRVWGATIPTVIIAIVLYVSTMCKGKTFINTEYISYACKMGIPLIPHNLSHMILTNADKVMIGNMISESASGIYGLVYNVGLMLSVLIEALNNVWNPWMFRKIEAGEKADVRRCTKYYLLGFTAITIAVMTISPEIVKIIAPQEYWEGTNIVNWIVYSVYLTFLYGLYVNIEFYYKKTNLISMGTVCAAVCNIVLNWVGLEYLGYEFAAVSTVISYVLLALAHMIIVSNGLKENIIDNKYVFLFAILTFVVMWLIQFFLQYLGIRVIIAIVCEGILLSILLVWLKRKVQRV